MQDISNSIETLETTVRDNGETAVTAYLMTLFPTKRKGQFVQCVLDSASGKSVEQSERLYRIAIALYANHYDDEHEAALTALTALCLLLDKDEARQTDCAQFLEETFPLVMRAARGLGTIPTTEDCTHDTEKCTALRILRK